MASRLHAYVITAELPRRAWHPGALYTMIGTDGDYYIIAYPYARKSDHFTVHKSAVLDVVSLRPSDTYISCGLRFRKEKTR